MVCLGHLQALIVCQVSLGSWWLVEAAHCRQLFDVIVNCVHSTFGLRVFLGPRPFILTAHRDRLTETLTRHFQQHKHDNKFLTQHSRYNCIIQAVCARSCRRPALYCHGVNFVALLPQRSMFPGTRRACFFVGCAALGFINDELGEDIECWAGMMPCFSVSFLQTACG